MRTAGSLLSLACAVACGCRAGAVPPPLPDPIPVQATTDPTPAPVREEPPWLSLPRDWRELSDLAFERRLDAWLPPGEARHIPPADAEELGGALETGDGTALRSAVILARTRDPRAGEALLARLERRVAPPPGASDRDAADVVAAAAFAEGTPAENAAARLASLAAGKLAHPDLCARVECARSALALGRDDGIPFLLQVLRTGTSAGRAPAATDRPEDLAFAQTRAAEALSRRAGTDSRFRPEASVKDREQEAARLEALLPRAPSRKR